jgi:hypothetical protein
MITKACAKKYPRLQEDMRVKLSTPECGLTSLLRDHLLDLNLIEDSEEPVQGDVNLKREGEGDRRRLIG